MPGYCGRRLVVGVKKFVVDVKRFVVAVWGWCGSGC